MHTERQVTSDTFAAVLCLRLGLNGVLVGFELPILPPHPPKCGTVGLGITPNSQGCILISFRGACVGMSVPRRVSAQPCVQARGQCRCLLFPLSLVPSDRMSLDLELLS